MDQLSTPRQAEILATARLQGKVGVDELAARFDVSPQTIRKDLNELCDRRLMTRIHGGAVIASGVENVAYEARRFIAQAEKRAIGEAAARLIRNNASLFINIGTTTEEVARALMQHEDLMVITNNLNVARFSTGSFAAQSESRKYPDSVPAGVFVPDLVTAFT